jgi:steroid delta-isomerase-like uncharacterized protein
MRVLWQEGRAEAVAELHAPDFIDRSPAGRGSDNAAFAAAIRDLYKAFPDFSATTEDLIIDPTGDKVAIRWSAHGTHRGDFLGFPPGGKRISFSGIEILTIAHGLVTERWGEWDGLALLEQLRRA